jgi:hypothetical protein
MKVITFDLKTSLFSFVVLFLTGVSNSLNSGLTSKEGNILAEEVKAIDLAKVMNTDNSWNKYPDYRNRKYWESLPSEVRNEYITTAGGFLDYNWPGIHAADYQEFLRAGDRRQRVYAACSNAL